MENAETVSFNLSGLPAVIVILVIGFLAYGIPAIRVARRTGKSVWVAALMSVPLVNIVVIWVFAYSRWPNLPDGNAE